MKFGIDRLIADPALRAPLEGRRVALVAHPASVTDGLVHSLDALMAAGVTVTSAFGPQHGLRGDKQDNMVETADETDPVYGIPVFSLYGQVRRPTAAMMDSADVFLFDLQDLGCRIYTFVTTLLYLLEEAAARGKSVWVLDRPNPAGRPVEGTRLTAGEESFVGAGPMPMRHGLTLGEMGSWFIRRFALDVDYRVIAMEGWAPAEAPGFGWPQSRIWINPSPNAASLNMARAYAGTVMLEGTTLSEGRGTTRPLEVLFGAPDVDARAVRAAMEAMAPEWLGGCALRECWFEPTFHKHAGALCNGLMVHAEGAFYDHATFRPWRLQALAFKAIRGLDPNYPLWRDFPYEYEFDRLAIDVINGGPALRAWVDDPQALPGDLEALASRDEAAWQDEVADLLLYR
ncbi:exo-beta-N-acetylmuramidase NamZ family protein [Novosphingobium soli]|uniref:Exo-beta-N-acetylmuramidase NamZ domain-containing protein n=1 Tax=Novosphingobium soli TaxID=574956 RepID=A0ABV6CT11_9SPHN